MWNLLSYCFPDLAATCRERTTPVTRGMRLGRFYTLDDGADPLTERPHISSLAQLGRRRLIALLPEQTDRSSPGPTAREARLLAIEHRSSKEAKRLADEFENRLALARHIHKLETELCNQDAQKFVELRAQHQLAPGDSYPIEQRHSGNEVQVVVKTLESPKATTEAAVLFQESPCPFTTLEPLDPTGAQPLPSPSPPRCDVVTPSPARLSLSPSTPQSGRKLEDLHPVLGHKPPRLPSSGESYIIAPSPPSGSPRSVPAVAENNRPAESATRRKIAMRKTLSAEPLRTFFSQSTPPDLNCTVTRKGESIEDLYKSDPKLEALRRLSKSQSFVSLADGETQTLAESQSCASFKSFSRSMTASPSRVAPDSPRDEYFPPGELSLKFRAAVKEFKARQRLLPAEDIEFVHEGEGGRGQKTPSGYFSRNPDTGRSEYRMREPVRQGACTLRKTGNAGVYSGLFRGEPVTVKVPTSRTVDGGAGFSAAIHEALVLMEIPYHANITSLIGVCVNERDEKFWLVFPYAKDTLRSALAAPLPVNETMTILFELVAVLAFLHTPTRGKTVSVFHRNISPDTLVFSGGRDPKAMIADFGNSEILSHNSYKHNIEAQLDYWWRYAPPEVVLAGGRPADGSKGMADAWDAWALGCVLHELLTQKHPFVHLHDSRHFSYISGGDELTAYTRAIETSTFIPRFSNRLDPTLLNVIAGLLHPIPAKRLTAITLNNALRAEPNQYISAILQSTNY